MAPGFLAPRAATALEPSLSYWAGFQKAVNDLWTTDNPDGYIPLVIAENRLSIDLKRAGLLKHSGDFPPEMLHYQDARGIAELRSSWARMLSRTFMKGVHVDPDHLSIFTGVGSVLELLFHCIASPGDAVIIPAPYYPAFDNDLRVRNEVHIVPAHLDYTQPDFAAGLDAAAALAKKQGRRVAAVLFTNPSNPQGTLLNRGQLKSIITWCLENKVHCIGDEIYALSVFDESAEFVSTSQLIAQDDLLADAADLLADLVHVVFGASKDFCGSGLRFGGLLSKNAALNQALGNLGYFCRCVLIPRPARAW